MRETNRVNRVNRAEPEMQGHLRPDTASLQRQRNCLVGWPAKLALAPQLSDLALAELYAPSGQALDTSTLANLPRPGIAHPIWSPA